jgi:hypothetical protein
MTERKTIARTTAREIGVLRPTLRKGAKDGAPVRFWLGKRKQATTGMLSVACDDGVASS